MGNLKFFGKGFGVKGFSLDFGEIFGFGINRKVKAKPGIRAKGIGFTPKRANFWKGESSLTLKRFGGKIP